MIFLSTLLRQHVYDREERRIGTLRDVCVSNTETFPVITALIVQPPLGNGNEPMMIPWNQIQSIEELPVHLAVDQPHIAPYAPQQDDLLLKRDILDKQIVDTQGFRVVKVNDLKLAQIKKTARLVGVDISLSGLLRRLGWEPIITGLNRLLPVQISERTVTWNYVEPVQVVRTGQTGQLAAVGVGASSAAVGVIPQVQLNVSHTKLADLHPADIADILEQLDVEEAGAMLDRLDAETAADTLNEVEYPLQSELLGELDPARASDLLEHLPPDDVADILADMPRAEAERFLDLMQPGEALPIRELLSYGAQTAGGIMTTEVLALPLDATVEEALAYLRQNSTHLEMIYYLYIIDEERHLMGVVSLRQLVTAEPGMRMQDLMDRDVIRVSITTDQEEVARIIAKYDLLGVPVVDAEAHLVGLVTVDDVIDVIHEEQAEDISEIAGADVEQTQEEERISLKMVLSRFSWMAVSAFAGLVLALIIYQVFQPLFTATIALVSLRNFITDLPAPRLQLGGVVCLIPMLLLTSGSAASQALGIAGWQLRMKRGRDFLSAIWREIALGTVGGVLTSILVSILAWLFFRSLSLSIAVLVGSGVALLVAYLCGLALPNLFQRLHLRGSLISAPLLDPVIAILSLGSFFAVTVPLISNLSL